jgi:hypothetical protein
MNFPGDCLQQELKPAYSFVVKGEAVMNSVLDLLFPRLFFAASL